MYADDTTVYFSDGDASKVGEVLENELNTLAGWISTNGLRLNAKKPQVMILSRKCRAREAANLQVKLGNEILTK